MLKIALVTTTINVPKLLDDYCRDIVEHGYKDKVNIIVVGDRKTPSEAGIFCYELGRKYKIDVQYLGIKDQDEFLESVSPEYKKFLPYNCIQRRNVGMLKAYQQGSEYIITIDDDNFLHTPNYIGSHLSTLQNKNPYVYDSTSGWYNVCKMLREKDHKVFYHRGYSWIHRLADKGEVKGHFTSGRIVVNAGLWLGDPDVDAVTRLAIGPEASHCTPGYLALGIGTKSPFNSQNTALHRDVIPAYCLGAELGRYDDIMASYIVKRIADHLQDYCAFGIPLVRQIRNEHDLWKDLDLERTGFQLIDRFVGWLYRIELKGTTYLECAKEIFRYNWDPEKDGALTEEQGDFLNMLELNYRRWTEIFEKGLSSS